MTSPLAIVKSILATQRNDFGFNKCELKSLNYDGYCGKNNHLSTLHVNGACFARNVECNFLGDFQTLRMGGCLYWGPFNLQRKSSGNVTASGHSGPPNTYCVAKVKN